MILKVIRNGLCSLITGIDCLTRPAKKQRSPEARRAMHKCKIHA